MVNAYRIFKMLRNFVLLFLMHTGFWWGNLTKRGCVEDLVLG